MPSEEPASTPLGRFDCLLALQVLGSGTLAGLYFIFSICVMPALDQIGGKTAIEVMNTINVIILNPAFMLVFIGTPALVVLYLALGAKRGGVGAMLDKDSDNSNAIAVFAIYFGSLLILVGEFGVTTSINVPLNDELLRRFGGAKPDALAEAQLERALDRLLRFVDFLELGSRC